MFYCKIWFHKILKSATFVTFESQNFITLRHFLGHCCHCTYVSFLNKFNIVATIWRVLVWNGTIDSVYHQEYYYLRLGKAYISLLAILKALKAFSVPNGASLMMINIFIVLFILEGIVSFFRFLIRLNAPFYFRFLLSSAYVKMSRDV